MIISLYLLHVIRSQSKDQKNKDARVMPWARAARNAKSRVTFVAALTVSLLVPVIGTVYSALSNLNAYTIYMSVVSFGMAMTFLFNFTNLPLALYHKSRENKISAITSFPTVSVVVPAYNEEVLIRRTLASLVECDYPAKEIIVIDDGSKDRTFQIVNDFAAEHNTQGCKFILAKKENGGKASAINFALRYATGEVVVVVDADSIIGRDALRDMVKHFNDRTVVAVGGNVKVLNRWNTITRCQALEYVVGINLLKRAFDIFGVVMIVPGALGAFRKSVLLERGSYDPDTLTEDFDATVKALKSGNSVQANTDALSYTEAPTTVKDLYKQRLRWNRGNLQTMLKHRDVMKNGKFGMLHDYGFPAVLLSMIISPFLGMVISVFTILAVLNGLWLFVISAFVMFTCLQMTLAALAMFMDNEYDWKLILYSPLFVIGYKQLMDYFMVKSIIDVLLNRKMTWTSAKRSGIITKEAIAA
jgi:poly-beta-1,6 N-acetyl-D-glucosamine synthase